MVFVIGRCILICIFDYVFTQDKDYVPTPAPAQGDRVDQL